MGARSTTETEAGRQRVVMEDGFSNRKSVTIDVLQGLVLVLCFFVVYVNELDDITGSLLTARKLMKS